MIKIYGIKNCDTIKKALKWLHDQGLDYSYHDYRKDGIDAAMMDRFEAALGYEALLNTRGTTWRKLPEDQRENINAETAKKLMSEHEAMIKRPLWQNSKGDYLLGFAPKDREALITFLKA